jgi:histidinol-phosphatase (PHP family)
MIRVNYHLHSTYSADGKGTMPEMCQAATGAGFTEVCFTEHLDFDRQDKDYGFFDYAAYSAGIEEARAAYAGRLTIRKGLEFDFRRAYGTEVGEVLAPMEFDFVLGSVHSAAGYAIYRLPDGVPAELDVRELLAEYFAEVEALAASGWCHAIGHLDYVYKQVPALVTPQRDAWYWRQVERILRRCIAGGVAIEVNTRHMHLRGLGMAADGEILKRYRTLGGRLLTAGTDAHRPSDIADGFAEAEKAIREAGFTAVTGYERGRPYAVPLDA